MLRGLSQFFLSIIKYLLSRGIILTIIFFAIFSIGGVGLELGRFLKTPITLSDEEYFLEIEPGMSITKVAEILSLDKIMENPKFFSLYGRFTGQAKEIKVGEYRLTSAMTPQDVLSIITRGRVVQYSFTIVEGWSFRELLRRMEMSDHLKQTLKGMTAEEIMSAIGYEGEPYEGYFLPDTYLFPRNYSDVDLLKRSYRAMQDLLEKAYASKDPSLPINSPHQLLTLASIIEKETGIAEERPAISGVFTRRLQRGMKLQTDPTVIYGLGENYSGTIYRSDLDRDTPYNTYTREGLPPTPIAMPSVAAIYAAAMPEAGTSLYFVAVGDDSGRHIFSDTLEEHNHAVKAYRQRVSQKE